MPSRSPLYWTEDHPVLDKLRMRRLSRTTPHERKVTGDGAKVGLAVEGGGMRAVISAAMLTALDDLGMTNAFDAVYGMSSGALNAAYYLTGEGWYAISIYYDDLPTRRFIDFSRPLRGKSIVDMDYVFDEVLDRRKPLDYDRVVASAVPLRVAITSVDKQATTTIDSFEGSGDLRSALRASSWLPGAVYGTADFRGERALDGGVLTAHPYALAALDGCTHILSLSTHCLDSQRRYSRVALKSATRYLDRIEPGLGDGYLRALQVHDLERVRLLESRTDPQPDPYVLDLSPLPGAPTIKRHEMDRGTIIDSARHGYELMVSAIERHPMPAPDEHRPRVIPRLTWAG